MWKKLFGKRKKTAPDMVLVTIEQTGALLMVRLCVNNKRIARIQCVVESDTTILIGDIIHHNEKTDYGKGYGTLMMQKFLEYAKENHYTHICGNLSEVDLDHKDRLHHFYQKCGFSVTEFPEPQGSYYGKIEMIISA